MDHTTSLATENREILFLILQGVVIVLVSAVGILAKYAFTEVKNTLRNTAAAVSGVQTQVASVQTEVAVFKESHQSLSLRVGSLEEGQKGLWERHWETREKIMDMKMSNHTRDIKSGPT